MKTKTISGIKVHSVGNRSAVSFKEKFNSYIFDLAQIAAPSMFMMNGSYVPPRGKYN